MLECLTEHSMKYFKIEDLVIENLYYVTSSCRTHVNGEGVTIWSQANLKCLPLNCEHFSVERKCELSSVSIKISKEQKILIVAVFKPPSSSHDMFFEQL